MPLPTHRRAELQLHPGELPDLDKPLLVWDGNCGFCHYWVLRWRQLTGGQIRYEPYQKVNAQIPGLTEADFRKAAYLIESNGRAFRGMGAIFRTLAYGRRRWAFLLRWYQNNPFFRGAMDRLYQWISDHRPFLFRLTLFFFGKNPRR